MQTKNLKKKGFTLVELVVVVAVIAVLSAILIPTIGCFVEEAKETNDMATVRLLNAALIEDGAENAQPRNMSEVINVMKNKGYLVDRLTPRSSGEILWDSANNRFLLRNKEGKDVYSDNTKAVSENYKLWKVVKSNKEMSEEYANYLLKDASFNKLNLSVTNSVDVGENDQISSVTYTGTQTARDITIRTNSITTTLTVNAAADTVNHYGMLGDCTVVAVDGTHCYNEFGSVRKIVVNSGKVITKSGSIVKSVFAEPAEGKNVTIDVSATPITTEVVVSDTYRNGDEIKSNISVTGKNVNDIQKESKADLLETIKANYTANYYGKHPAGFIVDETAKTITIKDAESLLYYGFVFDPKASANHCKKHINSKESCMWYNFSKDPGYTAHSDIRVLLDADVDFEGASFSSGIKLWHVFDGQNHTIKNAIIINPVIDDTAGLFVANNAGGCTIQNLKINNVHVSVSASVADKNSSAGIVTGATSGNIINVEVSNSSVTGGKYAGGIVGYAYGSIIDCNLTDCTVSGQYKAGGVVGYVCSETTQAKQVNNNTLSSVSVEVENLLSGTTAVLGKIVGHFNGEANTTGECKNNTFAGDAKATKNIGLITTVVVSEN